MWIGELMTEFAIGNGTSMIVFAGIVANIPTLLNQLVINELPLLTIAYIVTGLIAIICVTVWVTEADRPIPATYARFGISDTDSNKRVDTYIPIKINPVGVISIIFALTLTSFLQFIARYMSAFPSGIIHTIGQAVNNFLSVGTYYAIPIILLTIFFTYFYAPIVFNTKKIADNLQKQGAFVPSLRPGEETIKYFDAVLMRVIFYSAIFLAFIGALPYLLRGTESQALLLSVGGTSLLIVVSVVVDLYKKINARISVI